MQHRCRPFEPLDAMILVGALAVGFAGLPADFRRDRAHLYSEKSVYHPDAMDIVQTLHLTTSIWAALTVACTIIYLRQPRPHLRLLGRQPGLAACLAALLIGGICFGFTVFEYVGGRPGHRAFNEAHDQMFGLVPPAILGAWLAMALGGRWWPAPCWIDRLGWGISCGWVAVFLVERMIF